MTTGTLVLTAGKFGLFMGPEEVICPILHTKCYLEKRSIVIVILCNNTYNLCSMEAAAAMAQVSFLACKTVDNLTKIWWFTRRFTVF